MAAAVEDTGGDGKVTSSEDVRQGNENDIGAGSWGASVKVLSREEDDGGALHESKTAVIRDTHNSRFWAVCDRKLYRAVCVALFSSPG